ncbi:unnamed protein product [Allacma fusca]|uniref:Uncharacterized protein n=1 Tax=Allacma fusca TaxID=39272 RepID=A0A8J2PYG0_9HEXA|nr:unnamed protein product [Allacma fusca]
MLFVVSVIWYCAIGNNCYCVVSSFQNLKNKSWRDSGTTEKRSSKIVQSTASMALLHLSSQFPDFLKTLEDKMLQLFDKLEDLHLSVLWFDR